MRQLTLFLALAATAGCTTGGVQDAGPDSGLADAGRADAGYDAQAPSCSAGSTVGDACTATAECNDGCFCNGIELCEEGVCVAGTNPCDDEADCTTDTCDEDERRCGSTPDDSACADDDACNGAERCLPGVGCRPGLRVACVSDDPCQIGRCDPTDGCAFEVRDLDGDGFTDHRCGGEDCFDDPADGTTVFPGAEEVCGNALDDNCDGRIDYREPTCLGLNDTCDDAERLAGPGTFVRTTRGLASSYPLGCSAVGADGVFRFTLTDAQDVEVRVQADAGSAAVALRDGDSCASGPDGYCGAESVLARNLPAGEYAIIVKTSIPTSFTLSLTILDATPILPVDVCTDSTLTITASGSYSGFFADVNDDYGLSCRTLPPTSTAEYRDVAHRIVLDELSDVRLSARTTGTSSANAYVALVRDCTDPDSSIGCTTGSTAVLHRLSVPAGTYFVLIESSREAASAWSLDVDIQPAMPRAEADACVTAVDITGATATVSLASLVHDSGTSCGGTTSAARDANFFYTLTELSDVILTTNAGGLHNTSISSECGNKSLEIFCQGGTPQITRRFLRQAPGTYHVTVATTLASGDLVVSAEILPPTFPPDNDTCAMPAPLSDAVTFEGDLLAAGDDLMSCAPGAYPDAIHSLTLLERQNVTAVARRTGGIGEPLFLGLRAACDALSADLQCTTGTPALMNRTLDPGTYYFVVESAASFVGPYTLTVYLAAP